MKKIMLYVLFLFQVSNVLGSAESHDNGALSTLKSYLPSSAVVSVVVEKSGWLACAGVAMLWYRDTRYNRLGQLEKTVYGTYEHVNVDRPQEDGSNIVQESELVQPGLIQNQQTLINALYATQMHVGQNDQEGLRAQVAKLEQEMAFFKQQRDIQSVQQERENSQAIVENCESMLPMAARNIAMMQNHQNDDQ